VALLHSGPGTTLPGPGAPAVRTLLAIVRARLRPGHRSPAYDTRAPDTCACRPPELQRVGPRQRTWSPQLSTQRPIWRWLSLVHGPHTVRRGPNSPLYWKRAGSCALSLSMMYMLGVPTGTSLLAADASMLRTRRGQPSTLSEGFSTPAVLWRPFLVMGPNASDQPHQTMREPHIALAAKDCA
jgi:hypothetical protein